MFVYKRINKEDMKIQKKISVLRRRLKISSDSADMTYDGKLK